MELEKNEKRNREINVKEKMYDMKGIMGDSSDNLPGIRGIGEKGAVKLLQEYNCIENVIDSVENFTPAPPLSLSSLPFPV